MLLALASPFALSATPKDKVDKGYKAPDKPLMDGKYEQIRWPYLMPDEDLEAIANSPAYLMDIPEGGDLDVPLNSPLNAKNKPKPENAYERALVSTKIRPEFNNRLVKIPGFIVPLDITEDNKATTFFAVPFFGACIHVPPPPPNQIIYARYKKGVALEKLYDAVWFYGRLKTEKITNDMATAAYTLDVEKVVEFKPTDHYWTAGRILARVVRSLARNAQSEFWSENDLCDNASVCVQFYHMVFRG